jgi:hypothetical protein
MNKINVFSVGKQYIDIKGTLSPKIFEKNQLKMCKCHEEALVAHARVRSLATL